jgi:outer membrane protein assembly factor BamD (BamD/ComL family)
MIRTSRLNLIVLIGLLVPISLLAAEWYENYEEALQHIQRQEWQTALDYLNEAINAKADPKQNAKTYGMRFIDYFPYLYRGVARWELGHHDLAEADLKKAETLGEVMKASKNKEAPPLLNRYLNSIENRKAEARDKQLTSIFEEAQALFEQEKFEAAKVKFNDLLALQPNHPEAKQYITRIEDRLRPRQATQVDPSNAVNAEFAAGLELYLQREFDAAEKKFKSVLALDDQHPSAQKYLDLIAGRRRQPAVVKTEGSAAESADDLFGQGLVSFNAGDFQLAKVHFQGVHNLQPQHPQIQDYLTRITEIENSVRSGLTAYFEGDYDSAIARLSEVQDKHPVTAEVCAFLAYAYAAKYFLRGEEDQRLSQKAADAFKKVRELDASYQPDEKFVSPRITQFLFKI